ncbi:MAG TPA: vWA domain-containing protein [Pirellulales bacterium]|nr:vWA domain-containing protein [Pirellulales bacterium]
MRHVFNRLAAALVEPWVDADAELQNAYQSPGARPAAAAKFLQAATISAAAHAALLAVLAQFVVAQRPNEVVKIFSWTDEERETIELPELTYSIADPRDDPLPNMMSALALSSAPVMNTSSELESVSEPTEPTSTIEVPEPEVEFATYKLDDVVVRAGSVGEEVLQVDGAIDRLTDEILTHLEQSKLLVVWIMDASVSLAPDRQSVAERLERIYKELDLTSSLSSGALKSSVVAFGEKAVEMVPPTVNYAECFDAIRRVPNDPSGIENVFSTVIHCVQRYQKVRSSEHRRLMFVIWTDESGNDYARLEDAVLFCHRNVVPVYVVGPSAMFGQERGTLAYKHVDGKVYHLPIDRGPDAVRQERLNLPYWFGGSQFETLHSGLGPFALTRLAHETGGAYFIKDNPADRSPFPVETMRRYVPDYNSPNEYVRGAKHSPLRRAVLGAVDLTSQRKLKGTPRLTFAPTGRTFFQELKEAQQTVAYNLLTITGAVSLFGPKGLEKEYVKEPSPRWRAWYDLTYGRLLAMNARCNEYNSACAEMKGKGADFVDKQSNRWQFRPEAKIHFGSQNERMAKEAIRLLSRCVKENSGTPWAVLAARELEQPLGFAVDEAYVAPPPPPPPPPPPKAPPAKPAPPPPPSNERRVEQPKKLPKPVEVPLPKL